MTYLFFMLNERHQIQLCGTAIFETDFFAWFKSIIDRTCNKWSIQCKHTSHTESNLIYHMREETIVKQKCRRVVYLKRFASRTWSPHNRNFILLPSLSTRMISFLCKLPYFPWTSSDPIDSILQIISKNVKVLIRDHARWYIWLGSEHIHIAEMIYLTGNQT